MATTKVLRQYMAHFIDAANLGHDALRTSSWYWLGDDLEDFDIEMNAEVEIERDLLGNEYVVHDHYEAEAESDVFYARVGDSLFDGLQSIIDHMYTGSRCRTFMLEVHMWEDPQYGGIALPDPSANPKKKGWYEKKGSKYVLTNDTSPVSGKTYYYAQYPAVRRRCYITPTSFGGDTSGYQIPFSIKYYNDAEYPVVSGLFDISDKEFNEQ